MKRLFTAILVAIGVFLIFSKVFAGNVWDWSRQQTGEQVYNPFTYTIHYNELDICVGFYDYWGAHFQGIGISDYFSVQTPIEQNTATLTIDLPLGNYKGSLRVACNNNIISIKESEQTDENELLETGTNPNNDTGNFDVLAPMQVPSTGGIIDYSPEVKFTAEISGTYHGEMPIYYSAIDTDSGLGALKDQPIDVFYSDDDGYSWQKIAEGLQNTGVYHFDTTKVPDGSNYKIRVVALDGYDSPGNVDSPSFSVDNTAPTFDISISSPSPVKEKEEITLTMVSSEALKTPPNLIITRAGAGPAAIEVSGSGKVFIASYYVVRGYPGKAVIYISGEDLVGNIGTTITSGKTFSVERFGPPPPVVDTPVNNQIFGQPVITVSGKTQSNIEVALLLNGITKLTTTSLADGSFKIGNVSLSLTAANYGNNTLSITAIDEKGEESEEVVLKIKLNSPPKILSSSLVAGETLSGQKEIGWTSSDLNGDNLLFSIEYSNDGGITWDYIASDLSENSYTMDTTQLADGSNYFFRITADDGIEKFGKIFKNFTIKNNLPHISLDTPSNYFTNSNTPVFTGKVTGSEQNISSVDYSLDGGATWQSAIALDGEFNSLVEKIKIPIQNQLLDGKYTILIRAKDILNRSVKISSSFTVDTVPPFIESPFLDKIIDNSQDVNLELGGIQINFQGRTEPKAKIELNLEDKIYNTAADEKGDFEVKDATLPLHGPNKITLTSTDLAQNFTKITGVVILDNPSQISVLSPKEGEFLGGVKEFSWEVQDIDGDPITSQILYQNKDKEWIVLAKDITSPYDLDLSKIPNGNYQMKVVVSDGMAETEANMNISIDNVAPQVMLDSPSVLATKNTQPVFSGRASDDFSGIQYVEYSFDNVNWYKALITKGYQTSKANFEFQHRFPLEDGNYKVRMKVSDRAGNSVYSEPLDLTIDTTPPRIGSNLISSGSMVLFPDETGSIKLFKDTQYRILVSVAGDAKKVSLKSGEKIFDLNFNKATLLWESEFNFKDSGDYSLLISAEDGAGNSQTKEIASLNVIPLGTIYTKKNNAMIEGAKATLYFLDQNTNSWLIWDAKAFGQENPQTTDKSGEYGFLVPPGTYRLEVSHSDFKTVMSKELEIKKNYLINAGIPLTEKGTVNKILDYFIKIIGF